MTIEQAGSLGEIIGAVATVATLAYLAVQIRANTRMMRAQSGHQSRSLNANYAIALAQDNQLADVFRRGLAGFESLEPTEQVQFTFLFSQIVTVLEHNFQDLRSGVGSADAFERSLRGILPLLKTPGGKTYWRTYSERGGYGEDFRDLLDSRMSVSD